MRVFPRFLKFLIVVICLGLFISVTAFADEWKPIDPSDLNLKAPVVEKDADAEAIFWEVRIDDSQPDELVLKNYVRIKVFTDRGKESQSKIDISYLGSTRIRDVAARVIRPDGSIVELKKEDIFDRTIVKASGVKYKSKSFALPAVEPGVIIEYRWQEIYPGGSADGLRLQFQRDIPVQQVSYYLKPFQAMAYNTFHMPEAKFVKDKNDFFKMSMTNLPAYHEEPRMPPEAQVRAWVFLFSSDQPKVDADKFWKNFGRAYYDRTKDALKVSDDVKSTVAQVVGDAKTPTEKLQRIYDFCRTKIKNASDDASTMSDEDKKKALSNKTPSDTLKRGFGAGYDIDMLFGAMAKAAGFDVRPALSGNRGDLFFDPSAANVKLLGSSFIAVKVGEDWQYFSPSEMYTEFGMLGWPEEDQQALIADPKEPFWTKIPLSGPEKSLEKRTGKFRLNEDGTLEGDVRIEYTGHLGFDKKEYNDDDSPDQREKTLVDNVKSHMSTAELSEIKVENVSDPLKPFTYAYHVRVPGYAQRTGKRLFVQPDYFDHGVAALFSTSNRRNDVYFHYPWSELDHLTIDLPQGFELDSPDVPAPITGALTQGICEEKIKIAITTDKQTLVYDRSFFFGGGGGISFPLASYAGLKQLFDRIYQNRNHTITLKQAAAAAN